MRSLFIFCFLSLGTAHAQFIQKPIGEKSHPQSIYFYNSQLGFLGGTHMMKTTDGGDSWQRIVVKGVDSLFFAAQFGHRFHFFDASHGVAVTSSISTASGAIMITDDGGTTWKATFIDSPRNHFPFIGFNDVHFFDSNNGLAVGGEGRKAITSDGGKTWTASTIRPDIDLYDVHFINSNVGFIAAGAYILKTTNGGVAWAQTYMGDETLTSIHLTDALHGHAVSRIGNIYRTTDGGVTWRRYYFNYSRLNTVHFTDADHGYAVGENGTGNNIIQTIDGGENWEAGLQTFSSPLYDIKFLDENILICGTDFNNQSFLAKSTSGIGETQVTAFFEITPPKDPICTGSKFTFRNKGNKNYQHQWYVDGNLITDTYDFEFVFTEAGTHDVKLVTTNNNKSGVFNGSVNINKPAPRNYTITNPAVVCQGAQLHIVVNADFAYNVNTKMELWSKGKQLQSFRSDNRVYLPNGLQETATLTLKVKSDYFCYSSEQDTTFTVRVIPNDYKPHVTISSPVACFDSLLYFTVHNSDKDFRYNLDTPFGSGSLVNGTGEDLVIEIARQAGQWFNGQFRVIAWAACKNYPSDYFDVRITDVKADFTTSETGLFVDEELKINNRSNGASFKWDFGEDAEPRYANTQTLPSITYTKAGTKKISVVVKDDYGCRQTKDSTFVVAEHTSSPALSVCNQQGSEALAKYRTISVKKDGLGNTYETGCFVEGFGMEWEMSRVRLSKYDPTGKLLWHKVTTPNMVSAYYSNGIVTHGLSVDKQGNVYLALDFDLSNIMIDDVVIGSNTFAMGNIKTALVKFSPSGEVLWHVLLNDERNEFFSFLIITDVVIDHKNDVILSLNVTQAPLITLYQPDQKTVSLNAACCDLYGRYGLIIRLNSEGTYLEHNRYEGWVASSPIKARGWAAFEHSVPDGPKLSIDESNQIILTGQYGAGALKLGDFDLNVPQEESGFYRYFFMAILKDNKWIQAANGPPYKGVEMYFQMMSHVSSYEDQAFYAVGRVMGDFINNDPIAILGKDTINLQMTESFVLKWKYDGIVDWINFNKNASVTSVSINPATNKLLVMGVLDRFAILNSTSDHFKGLRSASLHDPFIAEYNASSGELIQAMTLGNTDDEYEANLTNYSCGQVSYTTKQDGNYLIKSISLDGTCEYAPPIITTNQVQAICKGNKVQLSALGASNLKWAPKESLDDPTIANPIASPVVSTAYTVTAIDGDCFATNSIVVIVHDSIPAFTTIADELEVEFKTDIRQGDSFAWDFGDGQTSDQPQPNHRYKEKGNYSVTLTVTNSCGKKSTTKTIVVRCKKLMGHIGFAIQGTFGAQFYGSAENGTVDEWDFGDGTTSTEQNPVHTFPGGGTYNVCLKVSNACGDTTVCRTMKFACAIAKAKFQAVTSEQSKQVNFVNRSSNASRWNWKFGDGSGSEEENPFHIYNEPGEYFVCLTAISTCDTSKVCELVNVTCFDAVPYFMSGVVFNTVVLTDTSDYALTRVWDFGDDTGAIEPTTTHTYAEDGRYTVCLTVDNDCGPSAKLCRDIDVVVTGIKEENISGVKIFPNPVRDRMTIQIANPTEILKLEMLNPQGQHLFEIGRPNIGIINEFLNFYHAAGIYLLRVHYKDKIKSQNILLIK